MCDLHPWLKLEWKNTRTRVRLTTRWLRMSCERMLATRCETLDRIVTAATTAMPPRRALKRRQSARTLPGLPSPPLNARHPHPAHTFPTALGSRSTHVGTPLAATRLYSVPAAMSSPCIRGCVSRKHRFVGGMVIIEISSFSLVMKGKGWFWSEIEYLVFS